MATIYIDNQACTFEGDGRNVLDVCLSLGFDVPFFCWHPALHAVGACRQCAVKLYKDEQDTRGRIVMSCMTPATDGMRISISDPEVVAFRKRVIEWLMVNHPHDCPVCDEGGECHLQDMTVMTGHTYREYRFTKRTYRNQHLGPFINHEMNRCIQCYRCVRFYRDYAGGRDFNVFGAHDAVYFGRQEDGVLESPFSGNLVEVCPTGVFTDKTQAKHYTRKWDLQNAPSLCTLCGLGCNTIPGERYGTLRRMRNRFNSAVNGYFLCDRGRFGYEFVNSDERIRQARLRHTAVSAPEALAHVAELLRGGGVIGIGSPRASLEANFALRALVGAEQFSHGMSASTARLLTGIVRILQEGPTPTPSIHEASTCDAVLILGEDVLNTAPRLALAIRQAVFARPREEARQVGIPPFDENALREVVQEARGPLFIATPAATAMDAEATGVSRGTPAELARLGFAVAHAIAAEAPAVTEIPADTARLAAEIAAALRGSRRPLIVAGVSSGNEAIIHAAANIAWALTRSGQDARLSYVVPACNSMGVTLLGGSDLESALYAVREGRAETVIVLENDLYQEADASTVDALFAAAKHVVALDALPNRTTAQAEVVLPVGTFAESDGTLVNNEGRAQRYYQVFPPAGEVQESWRWLGELQVAAGRTKENPWGQLDQVIAALAAACPALHAIPDVAPQADFRLVGQRIPRQPHRYSGRTAMHAHRILHEPKPPEDVDTPFAFSMEGFLGRPPGPLVQRFWAPGWNSVQSVIKFQQEVGGPLVGGDPGLRLIEPPAKSRIGYWTAIPADDPRQEEEWLILPAYHLFGSEPLSLYTPGMRERMPEPYLGLGAGDAARLRIPEGQPVTLTMPGASLRLPVRVLPGVPDGVALLPVLPGVPVLRLPASGVLTREEGTP